MVEEVAAEGGEPKEREAVACPHCGVVSDPPPELVEGIPYDVVITKPLKVQYIVCVLLVYSTYIYIFVCVCAPAAQYDEPFVSWACTLHSPVSCSSLITNHTAMLLSSVPDSAAV